MDIYTVVLEHSEGWSRVYNIPACELDDFVPPRGGWYIDSVYLAL